MQQKNDATSNFSYQLHGQPLIDTIRYEVSERTLFIISREVREIPDTWRLLFFMLRYYVSDHKS